VLGTLLALYLRQSPAARPEVIIPMPLHPTRHRERGFNQSTELARPLSALLGIPVDEELCVRRRATEDQTLLPARARRRNVRGAFAVARIADVSHVAILDDVLTTLSTAAELARTLTRAGVSTVEVWAIARALPGDALSVSA
jgi:ComF family protein